MHKGLEAHRHLFCCGSFCLSCGSLCGSFSCGSAAAYAATLSGVSLCAFFLILCVCFLYAALLKAFGN